MSDPPLALWLEAFVLTLAIELPIYWLLLGRRFEPGWTVWLVAVAVNVVTHPTLWYLFPRFSPYWAWVLVAETWVTATEGVLVAAALRWRPRPLAALGVGLVAALVANGVSTLVGLSRLLL